MAILIKLSEKSIPVTSNTLIATIATPNTTSYTETGLTKGTSYTRKIAAYNTAGNSAYSGTASVTTPAEPTAPSSFSGTAASSTSITWSWTDNSNDEETWVLQDSSGTTKGTLTSTTVSATGGTISYTETGLTKGTSYTRKMVARNSDGDSTATSTATVTTSASQPDSFSLLSPANSAVLTSNLPTFSFEKSADADDGIASYTLTVDDLTFTINPNGPTQHSDLFTAQYFNENDGNPDNDTISVTLKAGNSSTLPLDDGEHSWKVTATDGGGNTRTTGTRGFTVDSGKPAVSNITVSDSVNSNLADLATSSTTPTVGMTLSDALGLKEVSLVLEEKKVTFGIVSYSIKETTTFALSGTSQKIAYKPKEALKAGSSYRLTVKITDSAGNVTTRVLTLAVLSQAQQAAQEVAELDADTTDTDTIVEKLRNLLPKSPFDIPSLTAQAVLRRNKQADIFNNLFGSWLEKIALFLSSSDSPFARGLWRTLQAIGNFNERVVAFLQYLNQGARHALAVVWDTVSRGALAGMRTSFRFVAIAVNMFNQSINYVATVTGLDLSQKASSPLVDEEAVTAAAREQTTSLAASLKLNIQTLGRLFEDGQDTRVRTGLKNRQGIGEFAQKVIAPFQTGGRRITFAIRQFYETVFDKSPTLISNIRITALTPTVATIEWDTNHLTHTTKVNYGTTRTYGQEVTLVERSDHHRVEIDNLLPGTTYYFEVMNQNGSYVFDAYYAVTTPTEDEPTAALPLVPQIAQIVSDVVDVHAEADPDSAVIGQVRKGEQYRAVLTQGSWVAIILPSNAQGWVLNTDVVLRDQTGVSAKSTQTSY